MFPQFIYKATLYVVKMNEKDIAVFRDADLIGREWLPLESVINSSVVDLYFANMLRMCLAQLISKS